MQGRAVAVLVPHAHALLALARSLRADSCGVVARA